MTPREAEFGRLALMTVPLSLACLFPPETAAVLAKLKTAAAAVFAFVVAQLARVVTPGTSDAKTLSGHDIARALILAAIGYASTHLADILGMIPGLGSAPAVVAIAAALISAIKDYVSGPTPVKLAELKHATLADVLDIEATKAHNAAVGSFVPKTTDSTEDVFARYQALDVAQ